MLVQGIPMGEEEESDTDSCGEPSDSWEEWNKAECSDWKNGTKLSAAIGHAFPLHLWGKKVPHRQRPQLCRGR